MFFTVSAQPAIRHCRYSFKETFGKWRTGDLLLGLAYLARKEQASSTQVERLLQGHLVEQQALSEPAAASLKARGSDLVVSHIVAAMSPESS